MKYLKDMDPKLFYLIQWTWGLSVNLAGFLIFLFFKLRGCKSERFGYAHITYVPWEAGGLSMGTFIFMKADHPSKVWTYNTRIHEYGHTWQALVLGPFYYVIIAIPSFTWCNTPALRRYREEKDVSYYVFYPEAWANAWGQKATGMKMDFTKPE